MFSLLGLSIFDDYIYPFFVTAGKLFTIEWILWGAVIIEVVFILFFLIKSFFAYELRLFRKVDKLNLWLLTAGQIKEENLIEFNNKMKKVPKILRYQWQQYMLYRDKAPSNYMSVHNCVENPIKSSKLTTNIKTITSLSFVLCVFSFLFSCGALEGGQTSDFFVLLFKATIIPIIVLSLNTFYTSLLKIRQSNIQVDLFETFHIFERLIDRASTTIPQYVDFEVLFTRTEIKRGIPVLNEYLEKRAREEELELEKARINSVEHINYDFEAVGMDGALLLERAMKECEIYTNLRARLMLEIGQIESEIESYKKAYDNTQKDYQKKLQANKENIERLRTQQETTTNRIESNYIRKQQSDEIKKQQQVEKDFDDATIRYKQEIATISTEVDKRKQELDEKKKYIENVMLLEFKTYSDKVYKKLASQAEEKNKSIVEELDNINKRITDELEEANDNLIKKSSECEIARGEAIRFSESLVQANEKISELLQKKNKGTEKFVATVNPSTNENVDAPKEASSENNQDGYYDEKGYYIYPNGTYYDDKGNFFDGTGGYFDPQGNYFPAESNDASAQPVSPSNEEILKAKEDEKKAKAETEAFSKNEESRKLKKAEDEEKLKAEREKLEKEKIEAEKNAKAQMAEAKPEGEGHYDEKGNYIYADGSYYDERGYFIYPDGSYYDDKGNYFDTKGGHYDAAGKYYPSEEQNVVETKPETLENENKEEISDYVEIPSVQTALETPVETEPEKAEETVEAEETEETEEKRGRGRPKKQASEIEEETPSEEKKGRGRPKKQASETEEETASEEKKGRGRPKKEVDTSEEQKPKGTRGRPKKEADPSEDQKPKGTRGRPKKVVDENETMNESQEENVENAKVENQKVKALKTEMENLVNQINILSEEKGKQEEIDQINKRLSEIVLEIEKQEKK
ncbi:MAG: hypothetical protein WCR30_01580 [Clostridia bacterium]